MLIVNITPTENTIFKGRFFKKQLRPDAFKRSCMNLCGKSCTLLEFNESMLHTLDLDRLLKTFKGEIIGANKVLEKIVPIEYRFDPKNYFKKALVSSLCNNIEKNANNLTIGIKDENFEFSEEYCKLANMVKSFTLIAKQSEHTKKLSDYCFLEYGNFIRITDRVAYSDDIILNFDNLDDDCKLIIFKEGKDQLLYPDPEYFLIKQELAELLNLGINPKLLCAAFSGGS